MSHVQRTLKAMRKCGRICGIVERFVDHPVIKPGVRSDLFNIFDVVAMDPDIGRIIGVQVCGQDFAAHVKKITQEFSGNARTWIQCGGQIELWGWRWLKVERGKPARHLAPRIKVFALEDLPREHNAPKLWIRQLLEHKPPAQRRLF